LVNNFTLQTDNLHLEYWITGFTFALAIFN
jgi:hypothetical protein